MSHEKIDLYKVMQPAARFLLDRKYDRTIIGAEHIPDRPAIYVPNHIKNVDSPLIASTYSEITGKPMRFAAKREYFDGRGIDDAGKFGRLARFVMEYTHMIPVDRENVDMDTLLADATYALEHGSSVAIHAEGTRNEDGKIHRFRPGAAIISIANGVPSVPTGVVYDTYSYGRKMHVDIIFGQPLMPSDFAGPAVNERRQILNLTTALEEQVSILTGMERSGETAKLRKLRHNTGE